MAVVTRYVVIRHEREEGVFATQQEADAYDAMLDRAERLSELLEADRETHGLGAEQIEAVARLLAGKSDELLAIFAQGKAAKRPAAAKPARAKGGEADAGGTAAGGAANEALPAAAGQN
jgi:dsDNA-binding SOS-regulon protein